MTYEKDSTLKITTALIVFFSLLAACQNTYAQTKEATLSGYVSDSETGEALIGASVYILGSTSGVTTNEYGWYSLSLPQAQYSIKVSYVGYTPFLVSISLGKDTIVNVALKTHLLQELVITGNIMNNTIEEKTYNRIEISAADIDKLPVVFGRADLIKSVQFLPGVKTIGDGSSAMFIRGGNFDQNLILIDEAPIYNPAHMFGLVSVFNPDAIKKTSLYKSNAPAQYGGRIAGVLDTKMKEGNNQSYNFSTAINFFDVALTAQGPIKKGGSSFFVSARKSLPDLMAKVITIGLEVEPAYFDINIKTNTVLDEKNKLYLSGYFGRDHTTEDGGFDNSWGNTTGTLRWNYIATPQLFVNTSIVFSDYFNNLKFNDGNQDVSWTTGLRDFNTKVDFTWYKSANNEIGFGLNLIDHSFIPGESELKELSIARSNAIEYAVYGYHETTLTPWLDINYGLRLSGFSNYGNGKWYTFDESYQPIDTLTNTRGFYKTYIGLEPRVNLNFRPSPQTSLKISYARNLQYMQVLQSNNLSYTSLEAWYPANPNIKPLIADTYSLGWFHHFGNGWSYSSEFYYKSISNQLDYVEQARLINNPLIEGEVRSGRAWAYGGEFQVSKKWKALDITASYAYSRVFRQIDEINDGEEYVAPYDLPHDFKIMTSYKAGSRLRLNVAWVYTTGRPFTFPAGYYQGIAGSIPIYTERNANRMPNYHRLDFSAKWMSKEPDKWSLSIGIYNIYNRKNPLGYRIEGSAGQGGIRIYKYSMFGIFPNITYVLKIK